MPKNVLKGLSVILGVVFLYGCAATKNVEVRRYIEIKDRVDQDMQEGNAGFLAGTPQPDDRSEYKMTRKIYVFEVSKDTPIEGENVIIEDNDVADDSGFQDDGYEYDSTETLETLDFQDDTEDTMLDVADADMGGSNFAATPSAVVEYKVQKDDTLQKISKKFYDSFSKWPKIYDANKDVIDDPDRIKPGIVIQIPAL